MAMVAKEAQAKRRAMLAYEHLDQPHDSDNNQSWNFREPGAQRPRYYADPTFDDGTV